MEEDQSGKLFLSLLTLCRTQGKWGNMNIASVVTREQRREWKRRQEQDLLYQCAPDLARSAGIHAITNYLFARAESLVGADYGFLMLANGEGTELKGFAAHGLGMEVFCHERIDINTELVPAVLAFREQQPVVIADLACSSFVGERLQEKYDFMRSTWVLPLISEEAAVGVWGIGYITPKQVTPHQFSLLQLLRDEATLALEPAGLLEGLWESQEGKPPGLQVTSRDISARKTLEERQDELLPMLAHDIRNSLGIVLGYTEMLLDEAKEQKQATEDLLRGLKRGALSVRSLLANYLELSRLEAGRLILMKQPLRLNNLLRRIGQQYEAEAQRRHITLELHLQQELPEIEGDELALERILTNLVHNALKFTPACGQVTISSAHQDNEVVVAVADTGPGMVAEEIPLLFEKYRRAEKARSQEGTGLGLFIVKALVEAHGGRIEVQSTPGQGACFQVILEAGSPGEENR